MFALITNESQQHINNKPKALIYKNAATFKKARKT